jgi:ribose-phosphate pyrophosphokinase
MSAAICAFPGNADFAERARAQLGLATIRLEWRKFPDGESYLLYDEPVAGRDLALVCTLNDPDSKALALLFAARAAKELGAARVGLVAPYLGYMRQDRRFHEGEAVTSAHFAGLVSAEFDWLVTVDPHLHRRASLGEIYSIPAAAVSASPALAAWIAANVSKPLIVGPDAESEQWAAEVAAACAAPYVVMSKRRLGDRKVEIEAPPLARWSDRTPVVLDDIVSSARTMALAVKRIAEQGLAPPVCIGVHGIFSGDALAALREAGAARVVTTNTIEHPSNAIDVSSIVAREIGRFSGTSDAVGGQGVRHRPNGNNV